MPTHDTQCGRWMAAVSAVVARWSISMADAEEFLDAIGYTPPDGPRMVTDGGKHTVLSRNPDEWAVADLDRDENNKPTCPDCGARVGHSKGGDKQLPGTDAKAFGWSCGSCKLTFPSNCSGPEAPGFVDRMGGMQVEFRDGSTRWVPVPKRYLTTNSQ